MTVQKQSARFARNFATALGHCMLEDGELMGLAMGTAIVVLVCVGVLLLFFTALQISYELVFEPNAVNVASRLAQLSIDPSNWT